MRSMNSRCAGGWKRCFIFAAMRYSLMEMDSSFGSSIRLAGVAWSARAKGRAQSRRSMFRSRRWRRPPPRLQSPQPGPAASRAPPPSPPRPPPASSAAASLGRVASVKLFPVVCFKGRGRGSAAPAVRRRRVRGRGRGGGLYLGKSMGSMVFQSTENMAPWMPLEMSFVPRPRPKMPQTPSLATISLMALVYVIVVSAFVCL